MTFVLSTILKTSAILVVGLMLAGMLRKRSAALKHCVLCAAVFFSAITPVLSWVMPAWRIIRLGAVNPLLLSDETRETGVAVLRHRTLPAPQSAIWSPQQFTAVLWAIGFLISMGVLFAGLTRLRRIASAAVAPKNGRWNELTTAISKEYELRRSVELLQSQNPAILVTWGILHPKILLPAHSSDWPDDRIRAVLCHELAHIRRWDWLMQTSAEVVKTVYWFNPLLWLVCYRLRLESEYACDDAVLAQGIRSAAYAKHLLDVVHALQNPDRSWSGALAMARPSTVERRFKAMLNPAIDRSPLSRFAMCLSILLILGVTLPIAVLTSSAGIIPLAPTIVGSKAAPMSTSAETAPERLALHKHPQVPTPAVASQTAQQYTGAIESFDLKDLDIKDFFRLISNFSGLNIILDPGVSGTVTLTLTDVPWDQALDVVLKNHQLSSQVNGNVLRISTNATLQAEAQGAELITHRRVLNYAKAATAALALSKVITSRGVIIQDVRRNTVIVTDVPAQFARIDQMLDSLDTPAPATEPYVIKSGDTLDILVEKAPDLSLRVKVLESGEIHLPTLLTDVPAAGLSPAELKQILEGRLAAKNVSNPIVTVIVVP